MLRCQARSTCQKGEFMLKSMIAASSLPLNAGTLFSASGVFRRCLTFSSMKIHQHQPALSYLQKTHQAIALQSLLLAKSDVSQQLHGGLEALGRNSRAPKKANKGKRPCNSYGRKRKSKK
ncbi:unnamed protein product [Heterosigma akashiwo]